jgi:hypothetical protein
MSAAFKRYGSILFAALLLTGCAQKQGDSVAGDASAINRDAAGARAEQGRAGAVNFRSVAAGQRDAELVNPDHSAMALLYYDYAGIAPPIDRWVEEDRRVKYAQPIDKAAMRESVRDELQAAAAAVRDIGFLRLSMQANLSEYDPSYSEFTIRALSPSSVVTFEAFDQKISLKFSNGQAAQIWRVTPEEAQQIRDKVKFGSVSLDVLLRIKNVLPAPNGGTIMGEVLEYEMQEARRGFTLARVRLDAD